MRSYDGIDYRYTSSDADREKAAGIVTNLIGFRPEANDLGYSLSFYAGGTGVDDRLAIRCQYQEADWPAVIHRLRLVSLEEAANIADWVDELRWLMGGEASTASLNQQCYTFINAAKHDFQDSANEQWEALFSNESDVNSWCVVWRSGHHLNYLSFDQG
jgi:hypothetical protein